MLKAIALDMDNTLLNSNKEISVTNRDVLRYLNRKGIRVILCSGRPFATLKPFLDELHVTKNDDVCVCFNGGLVRLVRDHTVIKANTLSKEQIKPVYDLVKENGFKLDIVAEDEVYSLTEFGKSSYQTMIPKQMPFIDTTFSKVPAKLPIFKVVVAGEPAMIDAASDAAQSLKQLTVTRSRRTLLEILPPNVNKMNGLKAALNFYRIRANNWPRLAMRKMTKTCWSMPASGWPWVTRFLKSNKLRTLPWAQMMMTGLLTI